ncbi:MAG: lysophospholipid acyltransferase family protein [Candidatus Dormiibacterota bacterium]
MRAVSGAEPAPMLAKPLADPATLTPTPLPPAGGSSWVARGGPQALGFRIATVLVTPMPRALRYRLADIGGSAAFGILTSRARRARVNYSAFAPGDRAASSKLARGAFRNYARTILDFLILEKLLEELKRTPGAISLEPLHRALAQGNGAIVITPHLGNWDLGAAVIATCGSPVHAVTDPFGPPEVDDLVRTTRERLGVGVIPVGPASAREALRALRRNEVLLLACDIDKGGQGVPVTFLGREVVLPAGPATLSLRTGAPLIPGYMRRLADGRHESRMLEPLAEPGPGDATAQTAELTQAIASSFESMIRTDPAQWFAFHSLTRSGPGLPSS